MGAQETRVMEIAVSPDEKRWVLSRHASNKKILFITSTVEYGGAEKHLLELIRRLRGPGVQVSIANFDRDFYSERLDPDQGVRVISFKQVPRSLWGWVRLFRAFQPDVVVFVYGWVWALPWTTAAGAWLAGIRRRISIQHLITPPIEFTPELSALWKRRRSIRGAVRHLLGREPRWAAELPLCVQACLSGPWGLRISANLCTTIICVSNALRGSLVKAFGFPSRKMRTIYNGVSLSEFAQSKSDGAGIRAKLGIRPDEFMLVCTARLSAQKGIDILLHALARTLHNGVRCKCVIVGDGPLRDRLMEQAREMNLSCHVFFEGFQEDVRPYLHASSAFILTSRTEGLPLSILEAMACGLPSIVTDVGGNAEAVANQVHGLVVPPGSVDAVADAIAFLAAHPDEHARMSRLARARACEAFDIEVRMAEIKRLIFR
jgi:glycosyltransferase involved in cell wall biosynthesis